jgi:exodeoxyribonuclease V alpha subunit
MPTPPLLNRSSRARSRAPYIATPTRDTPFCAYTCPARSACPPGSAAPPSVDDGAHVAATGEWIHHPTHGRQFAFTRLAAKAPTTLPGIQRRLEAYPGVGPELATRIVTRFGLDSLTILDKQPRRLLEVKGIKERTLDGILEFHQTRHGPVAEVENQLLELDLPTWLAEPIVQRYPENPLAMLRERPYRLARDVRGIGFVTADKIARALGIDLESDERVDAGLVHVLDQAESDGHCALPEPILLQNAARLLELPPERIDGGVARLLADDGLVRDDRPGLQAPLCYPPRHYDGELAVARALVDLAFGTDTRQPWRPIAAPADLSPGQHAALAAIADAGLVILTGGPGTGKSTVTRQILEMASPTTPTCCSPRRPAAPPSASPRPPGARRPRSTACSTSRAAAASSSTTSTTRCRPASSSSTRPRCSTSRSPSRCCAR